MIKESSIKDRNFSVDLPSIIGRLNIIYERFCDDTQGSELVALLDIMEDSINDLKAINTAFYGPETTPEPDTAPISADKG